MHNDSEIKVGDRVTSTMGSPRTQGTVRYLYPGRNSNFAVVQWGNGRWASCAVRYLRKAPTVIRAYNVYWDAEHMKVVAFWSETREIADEISHHSDARLNSNKRIGVLNVYDNGEVELEPCQQQQS